jgi:hypothetical protein
MSKIEDLERQIQRLSPTELVAFREWFAEFDAAAWDRQLEADVKSGKLEALGDRARKAHAAGTSSKL